MNYQLCQKCASVFMQSADGVHCDDCINKFPNLQYIQYTEQYYQNKYRFKDYFEENFLEFEIDNNTKLVNVNNIVRIDIFKDGSCNIMLSDKTWFNYPYDKFKEKISGDKK